MKANMIEILMLYIRIVIFGLIPLGIICMVTVVIASMLRICIQNRIVSISTIVLFMMLIALPGTIFFMNFIMSSGLLYGK